MNEKSLKEKKIKGTLILAAEKTDIAKLCHSALN